MLEGETRCRIRSHIGTISEKNGPKNSRKMNDFIFEKIGPGDRIFVDTGCGEPQYLVRSLLNFVKDKPKAFLDAELMNIVTLGVAPYTDEKFRYNFRLNSFFIGDSTRNAINEASADYTPIFLSSLPSLILSERIPIDVALIQTSLPDIDGNMNLGISVDIVRAAVEKATLVIAQPNSYMPSISGDGWISMDDVDYSRAQKRAASGVYRIRSRRDSSEDWRICGTHCGRWLHHPGGIW